MKDIDRRRFMKNAASAIIGSAGITKFNLFSPCYDCSVSDRIGVSSWSIHRWFPNYRVGSNGVKY